MAVGGTAWRWSVFGRWGGVFSRSNLFLVGTMAAAGTITWFGISGATANEPPPVVAEPEPATIPAEPTPTETPAIARVPAGRLPTRVVIPSAGVDAPITEVGIVFEDGEPVWETAWRAVGHHLDSARPGQPGNMVLTGHVSVADPNNVAHFARLDRVHEGDVIEVYAGDRVYRYQVTNVRVVDPSDTHVLRSDHRAVVTLITCTPDLKHRLVVTGHLV